MFNGINCTRSTAEGLKLLTPILLERLANQETVDSSLKQLQDLLALYEDNEDEDMYTTSSRPTIQSIVRFFENKTTHPQWEVRREGIRILETLINGLASMTWKRRIAEATLLTLSLLLADQNIEIRETAVTLLNSGEFSGFHPVVLPGRLPHILQRITIALDGTESVAMSGTRVLLKISSASHLHPVAVNEDTVILYPVLEAVLGKLISKVASCIGGLDCMYYLKCFDTILKCSIPTLPTNNDTWNEMMLRAAIQILDHADAFCDIQFVPELNPVWKFTWMLQPVMSQISQNDEPQIADRAKALFRKTFDDDR